MGKLASPILEKGKIKQKKVSNCYSIIKINKHCKAKGKAGSICNGLSCISLKKMFLSQPNP